MVTRTGRSSEDDFQLPTPADPNRKTCPRIRPEDKRSRRRLKQSLFVLEAHEICSQEEREGYGNLLRENQESEKLLQSGIIGEITKTTGLIDQFSPWIILDNDKQLRQGLQTFEIGLSSLHEDEADRLRPYEVNLSKLHHEMALNMAKLDAQAICLFHKDKYPADVFKVMMWTRAFLPGNNSEMISHQIPYNHFHKSASLAEVLSSMETKVNIFNNNNNNNNSNNNVTFFQCIDFL
jgi:hypothetical protein